jgi:hypothetical protein
VGDQLAIPGQDGVGLSHSCDLGESRAAEPMPDFTKRGALGVRKLQASIQLVFQNAVLGGQIFIPRQQFFVHRPSDVGQHACPIHDRPPRADLSKSHPGNGYREILERSGFLTLRGLPSLATAALIGWEWLQREIDIFATFEAAHYRPNERPNAVRVVHEKTGEENWIPLFDDQTGGPFFPVLMAELDALKRTRIAGLMLRRDWGKHDPWPTFPKEDEIDLTHMSRKVKEVIRAAGLRDELTFTSFRHGGFTQAADSDLTDAEMRAQGRHKSAKVLPRYAKRTMKQVAKGIRKRQAARTKTEDLSE